MRQEGGCGYWPLGRDPNSLHSRGVRYVLCIRNRPGEPGHGEAYFVATLAKTHAVLPRRVTEAEDRNPRRQLLRLIDCAPLDLRTTWPVRQHYEYGRLASFGIDAGSLSLRPFVAVGDDEENDTGSGERRRIGDGGPSGGGVRSEAVWNAQHSQLWERISSELNSFVPVDGYPWRPDILCEAPDKSLLLIEVKPACDSHNIITAIGQLIAYSSNLWRVTRVIAAPGTKLMKEHLVNVIKAQGIKLLDLDDKLGPQLRDLLSTTSRR